MANQLKLVATITPANTAVEASTDNGATWEAVAMSTVGSQQEGLLVNVPAGTYPAGAVKLRAVAFPAVVASEPLARTVLGEATSYDGPIQFRPTAADIQQVTALSANERFALGAVTNTSNGITDEAQLSDGAWLSYADFNTALVALSEVEVTSSFTFSLRRTSATAQLLTADIAFSYLSAQPYGNTPIRVAPAARDYATNLRRAVFTDYRELDALAAYEVETNATSLTYAQFGVQNGANNLDGVAIFDGSTLVTAALPATNNAVETQTITLPGTGLRRVRVVNGSQQRYYDSGTIGGVFLANAGFSVNAGATARIVHPVRQTNRLVVVADSILAGIISDANTAGYVSQRDSSIALLRAALPTWEIYLFGYGGAQNVGSLGVQADRDAFTEKVAAAFAGTDGKTAVYFERGINDFGQRGAPANDCADAIGQTMDTLRNRLGSGVNLIHQSLFPSSYESTARPYSNTVRARLTGNRPWVLTTEGPAILPLSNFGPDGLHATIAGQRVLATNLTTFINTL